MGIRNVRPVAFKKGIKKAGSKPAFLFKYLSYYLTTNFETCDDPSIFKLRK